MSQSIKASVGNAEPNETEKSTFAGHIIQYENHMPLLHPSVYIAPTACVIGAVSVGENSSIWFGAVLRGDEVAIHIGTRSNIQDGVVIHGDAGQDVMIGNDVTIGHGAIIHGCVIEDGALIGMGAVVLDGAVIESGALVAAGAVVSPGKRVEANSLWAGVPAKPLKMLDANSTQMTNSAEHYRLQALRYRSNV